MLRATIPADSGLVVGETVRISILEPAAADALNLPRNAVVQLGEGSGRFRRQEDGFEAVPVTVLAQGAERDDGARGDRARHQNRRLGPHRAQGSGGAGLRRC